MTTHTALTQCTGSWSGTNHLWLTPDEPARESETAATITLAARDACLAITYTWAEGDTPHDGVLLVRLAPEPSARDMVWIDSFHTGGTFMEFRGVEHPDGALSALGSYPAPPGPDWGWRITLEADPESQLRLTMFNITPDGEEMLAVKAELARSPT